MSEQVPEYILYQRDMIKSVAIFFVILASQFNVDLLTCYQRKYIDNNKFAQYLLGFLCLFFLVTLFSETGDIKYVPPLQKLINTFFYFIVFILTLRLDYRITFSVLFLISIIYFIQLTVKYYTEDMPKYRKTEEKYGNYDYWLSIDYPFNVRMFPVKDNQIKELSHLRYILYYIVMFLLLIGVICYGGELRDKKINNKSLTWFDVIMDTSVCKEKEPKSLWYYFKMGLGVKI